MNYIDLNEVSAKIAGFKKEEMIGKNILDIFPYMKTEEMYDKVLGCK